MVGTEITLWDYLRCVIAPLPYSTRRDLKDRNSSISDLKKTFWSNKKLSDVSKADIVAYTEWLINKKMAPDTVRMKLRMTRDFFKLAVDNKFIKENPFDGLDLSHACYEVSDLSGKVPKIEYVSRELINIALRNASPIMRLFILLARCQGLIAPSEACRLRWAMIDLEKDTVTIDNSWKRVRNHKAPRTIPLFPEVKKFLATIERKDEFVAGQKYYDLHGGPAYGWDKAGVGSNSLIKLLKSSGIVPWSQPWYNLRYSFIVEQIQNKVPYKDICTWCGIQDFSPYENYAQTMTESNTTAWSIAWPNGQILNADNAAKISTTQEPVTPTVEDIMSQQKPQHETAPNDSIKHNTSKSIDDGPTCKDMPVNADGLRKPIYTSESTSLIKQQAVDEIVKHKDNQTPMSSSTMEYLSSIGDLLRTGTPPVVLTPHNWEAYWPTIKPLIGGMLAAQFERAGPPIEHIEPDDDNAIYLIFEFHPICLMEEIACTRPDTKARIESALLKATGLKHTVSVYPYESYNDHITFCRFLDYMLLDNKDKPRDNFWNYIQSVQYLKIFFEEFCLYDIDQQHIYDFAHFIAADDKIDPDMKVCCLQTTKDIFDYAVSEKFRDSSPIPDEFMYEFRCVILPEYGIDWF